MAAEDLAAGCHGGCCHNSTGAVIDIDLTVADPAREQDYVPALETAGFWLIIREPWWHGHRMLQSDQPPCNLHVFGFDSPELIKHRIFRDWLRGNPGERDRYAAAKRQAAAEANAAGSTSCSTTPASSRSSGRSIAGRSRPQACSNHEPICLAAARVAQQPSNISEMLNQWTPGPRR